MKITVFSAKSYDRQFLTAANADGRHELLFCDARLTNKTAALARGSEVVCAFANDDVDRSVMKAFADFGIRMIALRSAGFDNVDLAAAAEAGIVVGRVPAYSPNSVAEHAFALLLTLDRRTHRAFNRVREGNFSLDGQLGFDLAGRTIGIVGLGSIGSVVAKIAKGFGCKVLGVDPLPRKQLEDEGVRYVTLDELLRQSDIVTLHCPLEPSTRHLIDAAALERMKSTAILINTSRGAVIDTHAMIEALKRNMIGGVAVDVYEGERDLFFEDRSSQPILDDLFVRLLAFPNVIVTGHQGFFTVEALTNIASTTLANVDEFMRTGEPLHPVAVPTNSLAQPVTAEQYVVS